MIKQFIKSYPQLDYRMPSPNAKITDGVLRSERFNDIYFSSENGLAEVRHVFIEGTRLADQLKSNDHLVIAETGFGTGLNFLTVLDLLKKLDVDCVIDYISFEAYPLDKQTAYEARKPFRELKMYSSLLFESWPDSWACSHHRLFLNDRVHLHLHYGDACEQMKQLDFKADVWFLDGFSPSKNADLWTGDIFYQIARLSSLKARFATYSVASSVKEGLFKSGFKIEKQKGFGKKREMLFGYKKNTSILRRASNQNKNVIVIGAGIAGASIAHGLRTTNIPHLVLEGSEFIAQGASGNPAGLQSPQLMAAPNPSMQMSLACFSYARRLAVQHEVVLSNGLVSLNYPEKQGNRQKKMAGQKWPSELIKIANANHISQLTNIEITEDGYIQSAGQVINPVKLTESLLAESEVITGVSITSIKRINEKWEIKTSKGQTYSASDLVLCIGSGLPQFLKRFSLPSLDLQVTSGQLSFLPKNTFFNNLSTSLQYGGYITPMLNGKQVLGASFDLSATTEVTKKAHFHNISLLPNALRKLMPNINELQGRVSQRLASNDRLPLVGDWHESIHLFSALGSRGLTNAPLLGLVLARKIAHRPTGLERNIMRLIDPERFSIRATRSKSRR